MPPPVRLEEPVTLPPGGAGVLPVAPSRGLVDEARERTLALIEPVAGEDLDRVHSPLMSPLSWDLGHIAAFEDLWACHRVGGLDPLRPELMRLYDAADNPRADRG